MSGRYLTDLADVLRRAGQRVVELDGWRTRARSSGGYSDGGPWVIMLHHTASAGDGASDAQYCTFSDSDRPLTNLVLGRDATWYVCAAGSTNTNGKGGPYTLADGRVVAADQMNLRAIGIEMSNNGVGMPYPAVQINAMFAGIIALAAAYLAGRVDLVCQHVDWAPGRKIDPATGAGVDAACGWQPSVINANGSWRLADVVAEATRRAGTAPTPTPPSPDDEEDDMPKAAVYQPNDDPNGPWLWWDGERMGWVRDPAQLPVGRVMGVYANTENAPLGNFSKAQLQQMAQSSWADTGPRPDGY